MIQYKRFDIIDDDKKDKNIDKLNRFLADIRLVTVNITIVQPHFHKEEHISTTHIYHIFYKISSGSHEQNGNDRLASGYIG